MCKRNLLNLSSLLVALTLAAAQPASASLDIDGTPWSLEFDGAGSPADQGWTTFNYNGSTFNDNYKLGTGEQVGYLTANGNPGGSIGKAPHTTLTKAGGWTVEWRLLNINTQTINGVQEINDNDSMLRIDYAPNSITLRDGYPVAPGNTSDSATVNFGSFAEHTFRLIRMPGSSTVELYIDNDFSSPAAQISPLPFASFNPAVADSGNINSVYWGNSIFEASWDFYRLHSGATVPEPASMGAVLLAGMVLFPRKR